MTSIDQVLPKYLNYLGIPVAKSFCQKLVLSHPEFPSLLSLAEIMQRLGVPHLIVKIQKDELSKIAFPYLLHSASNGGEMLFVKSKSDLKKQQVNLARWSGVILQAEKTKIIKDSENNAVFFKKRIVKYFIISLLTSIFLLLISPILIFFSWSLFFLWITSLGGILIGYVLIAKDLGTKYKVIEHFCNSGLNSSCNQILTSNGATLFGVIKLSEIVLAYFLIQCFLISISTLPLTNGFAIILILRIWSLLSVPVVVYSVFYQNFVAKAWCKLCLLIDALLLMQMGLLLLNAGLTPSALNATITYYFILSSIIFFIILTVICITKYYFEAFNKILQSESQALRVKNNPIIFAQMLSQQRKVDVSPFKQEIRIGNINAPVQILVVSSLFCRPCQRHHSLISQLVTMYPDILCITFRFVRNYVADGTPSGKPITAQYLIQYWLETVFNEPNESEKTEDLMNSWFDLMSMSRFKKSHFLDKTDIQLDDKSEAIENLHNEWQVRTNIASTPTTFINGYLMPKEYTAEDLKALIPGLSELFQLKKYQAHNQAESLIIG